MLALLLWWLFRGTGPHLELSVDLQSPQADMVQVFYDHGSGGYSERESIIKSVHPGANHVEFILPAGPIFHLRLDPVNSAVAASVSRIALRQSYRLPWQEIPLAAWQPAAATVVDRRDGNLALVAGATADPQLQFVPPKPLVEAVDWGDRIERDLLAGLFGLIGCWLLRRWLVHPVRSIRILIPMGMAAAGGLILALAMTATTQRSVHPDEFSHLGAYQYYTSHWLPPAVDDPATIPSTSVWGYSYLSELDVVYELAARLTAPLAGWIQDDLRAARLFQFGLWVVLCVMAACSRRWMWGLSAVLLSPQIWYVFSYFNADAFPLFLSLIVAVMVTDEDNGLHRFLEKGGRLGASSWVAMICIGLLLVSKSNYLPASVAFFLWLGVVHLPLRARFVAAILGGFLLLGIAMFIGDVPSMQPWHWLVAVMGILLVLTASGWVIFQCWESPSARPKLLRLLGLVSICIAVALPRLAWDVHINGWPSQKATRVQAVAEARAADTFKPSLIASGKGNPTLQLASKGVSIKELMFAPYGWAVSSVASSFGVYGYMNIFVGIGIYILLAALAISVGVFATIALRQAQPEKWLALVAILAGTALLVIASSLLFSWVVALQAQGRYLFPLVALAALAMGAGRNHLPQRTLIFLLCGAAFISIWSFAAVALPAFARGG